MPPFSTEIWLVLAAVAIAGVFGVIYLASAAIRDHILIKKQYEEANRLKLQWTKGREGSTVIEVDEEPADELNKAA